MKPPVRYLLVVGALVVGAVIGGWFVRDSVPGDGMVVRFVNADSEPITSIHLQFGNPAGQSDIRVMRLPVGESRQVLLNHSPGMGFNVDVRYASGATQTFCALKGDSRHRVTLPLKR